ncbi:mismatch repair endonuclease PMS2, partial [Thraustotheca clavata]
MTCHLNFGGDLAKDEGRGKMELKSIPKQDVMKICSGQSVVDLATAVKELVENALDAGATQIDVKLKEYGQLSFEVSDNGKGIASKDHAAIALKHYTSKISAFEDLESVASFGFRGEALSSMCQLATTFTVHTRTEEDPLGVVLGFDPSGVLVTSTLKARPVGTTVIVENLFKPLPVRHKDFVKNIKRHYGKLLKILQAYAIITANVQLSCINFAGKNNVRQAVLSTQKNSSMNDNIANIYGTKFLKTLLPVQKSVCLGGDVATIVGFVSKVGEGVGRSDNDRQFFYVNGRPVDLPNATKAVNEIWRQFEMKNKPACFLDIKLPSGCFDVNVTPDKREVFVKEEVALMEALREDLLAKYEPTRGTFHVQPLISSQLNPTPALPRSNKDSVPEPSVTATKRSRDASKTKAAEQKDEDINHEVTINTASASKSSHVEVNLAASDSEVDTESPLPPKKAKTKSTPLASNIDESDQAVSLTDSAPTNSFLNVQAITEKKKDIPKTLFQTTASPQKVPSTLNDIELVYSPIAVQAPKNKSPKTVEGKSMPQMSSSSAQGSRREFLPLQPFPPSITTTSMADITKQRKRYYLIKSKELGQAKSNDEFCCIDTEDESNAIARLQRTLTKDDFAKMEIIGQFNLGFIIARSGSDLYIIDQHASDEKYRFETLQKTTTLHQQPLVQPMAMELTAVEEMTILEHLPIFEKQGFHFAIDATAPVTKKLKLISLPFSKHTTFGLSDVRELASLLMEAPHQAQTLRLPKVTAMFASRACRSAVMIGTALRKEEMQKIVTQLSTLDQPWNCPHGRPTMRHLVDLNCLG